MDHLKTGSIKSSAMPIGRSFLGAFLAGGVRLSFAPWSGLSRFCQERATCWSMILLGIGLALVMGACAPSTTKDQPAALQKDASYWKQLTALMKPVEMKSMTDHRAYILPSGVVLALHFDSMDLNAAQNLNWIALGIPARFCKEDQERLDKAYGPGFTHFHDLKNDTHGGAKGSEGVWFIHIAVRSFDSPMSGGKVPPGPDLKFMPTLAPTCS